LSVTCNSWCCQGVVVVVWLSVCRVCRGAFVDLWELFSFSGEGMQEVWNERNEMDVDIQSALGKGCLFVRVGWMWRRGRKGKKSECMCEE
jgi:hypothetical protein